MKNYQKTYSKAIKNLTNRTQEKYNLTKQEARALVKNTLILGVENNQAFEKSIYYELKENEIEILNFIRENAKKIQGLEKEIIYKSPSPT